MAAISKIVDFPHQPFLYLSLHEYLRLPKVCKQWKLICENNRLQYAQEYYRSIWAFKLNLSPGLSFANIREFAFGKTQQLPGAVEDKQIAPAHRFLQFDAELKTFCQTAQRIHFVLTLIELDKYDVTIIKCEKVQDMWFLVSGQTLVAAPQTAVAESFDLMDPFSSSSNPNDRCCVIL